METIYAVSKGRKIGFVDSIGNMLTDYEFDGLMSSSNPDNAIIVIKDERRGLVNAKGLFTPCVYDEIDRYSKDGYITVKNNGKEGLINPNGHEISPCIYDYIKKDFNNDRAMVIRDRKYGFINSKGEEVIPCIYDSVLKFADDTDVTFVELDGKMALINKEGIPLTSFMFTDAHEFANGAHVTSVAIDGKYGLIDTQGNPIVPFVYSHMSGYDNGYFCVSLGEKFGVIDTKGRMIIPCVYDGASNMTPYGIAVMEKDGRVCIVNKNNKVIPGVLAFYKGYSERMSDMPDYFSEGIGKISDGKLYGFVNTDGTIITKCLYEEVGEFSEGLVKVCNNGKWGFIDKTAQQITDFKYEEVENFFSNYAFVYNYHPANRFLSKGMIDRNGNEIIPCEFSQISRLSSYNHYFSYNYLNDYFLVKDFNGNWGVYDSNGIQIIPCVYSKCEMINDKYFLVTTNDKIGIIDKDGSNILPYIYDQVLDEYQDTFIVKKEDKFGIVDKNNTIKVHFNYVDAKPFIDGLTMVSSDKIKYYLIDVNNNKKSNDFSLFGIVVFNNYVSFRRTKNEAKEDRAK